MKSKFTWYFSLVFILAVQIGFAQQKDISGVVKDSEGYPIPGASIEVVGTTRGVTADDDGSYTLKANTGERISVSMIGYTTQTLTVGTSNLLNVVLMYEEDGETLEGIVIDSYRQTSKPKSNVASTVISSETIGDRPNASFVQTLQGQVPGLNIATGSGQPGSSNTLVLLRGVGSINGNTSPLFVVDGIQMGSANFRSINPNEIENVTILKDAGATSIYGNRGANGVIVVTTKRANFEQDLQIKYSGTTGISTVQRHNYNLMDGAELMRFENQTEGNVQRWKDSEIENAPNVDWIDHFFREAISTNHTLSLTSGAKNLAQFTSLGYAKHEGILRNTDLQRFSFRNNLTGKSNNSRLTFSTGLNFNYSRSNQAVGLGTGGVNHNPALAALNSVPYLSLDGYDPNDAENSIINMLVGNPNNASLIKGTAIMIEDKLRKYVNYTDEIKAIANGNINYDLGSGFSTGVSLGVDFTDQVQTYYDSPSSFNSEYFREEGQEYLGYEGESRNRIVSFNTVSNLKWKKLIDNKHDLSAGVFVEYLKAHGLSSSLEQNGLQKYFSGPGTGSGWIGDNDRNDLYVPSISKSVATSGLFSYFGTFDYDYDYKYGLGLTVRRDASFRFSEDNRWGTFWSVSARWNIDREDFMMNSVINELKLRGSYGTSGNQDIVGTGLFGGSSLFRENYSFSGLSYNDNPTLYISNLPNRNLKWETVEQANIGVDFGVWNSRLRGSFDLYQKTTKDLYQSRSVSAIHGTGSVFDNIGSMRNRGVELMLAGDIIRNDDFRLTLNVNGSYNKNELVELANPNAEGVVWGGGLTTLRIGDSYGQFYLAEYAGVNPENGNLLFLNQNGEAVEKFTNADRKYTGKSFIPTYQGGFGLDAQYKGWFLTANFTFVADIWRFDYDWANLVDTRNIGNFAISRELYDYWTPENRDASMPGLSANNLDYQAYSDRNLKDASYVRLRYLSLGYNFNPKDLKMIKLTGLRVFAQAENLHTWSNWKGWDAESFRANDQSQYPTPRTVSFGVEVQF